VAVRRAASACHSATAAAGDLPFRAALIIGLDELGVLLPYVLGVLAGRAEQQLLEVVGQVLAWLRGHLPVSHPGFQVANQHAAAAAIGGRALAGPAAAWAGSGGCAA